MSNFVALLPRSYHYRQSEYCLLYREPQLAVLEPSHQLRCLSSRIRPPHNATERLPWLVLQMDHHSLLSPHRAISGAICAGQPLPMATREMVCISVAGCQFAQGKVQSWPLHWTKRNRLAWGLRIFIQLSSGPLSRTKAQGDGSLRVFADTSSKRP